MKNRKTPIMIIYVVILVLVFSWMLGIFGSSNRGLTYSQVVSLFRHEQVRSFTVEEDTIYLKLHTPVDGKTELTGAIADAESFRREMWDTIQTQSEAGILESYNFLTEEPLSPYDFIVPIILAGIVILLAWMIIMGRANAKNPMADFGKARTINGSKQKVTFADVAGVDEEKAELQEVVDFLRNPQKFTDIGAKIPHGILLSGAPGTGKTMLAKAVAGEAGVQFLSISGSDFMEMYVGVGASRVRDLFQQAKKIAPAIIFIDEIDAVGRKRGSGLGGGHDEREQTLNQLLVEMDGFDRTEGVIVLAATNRPDILDPALLRPGRFDRQIYVNKPDVKGREAILKVHAKDKRLDDTVDLHLLARSTVGFTGADLSNLLNEAAILAAREDRKMLGMEDLNNAMMKIMAGPEKRSHLKNRKDLKETAIHEAGHAIAMYRLPTQDKVLHVTIIPRGGERLIRTVVRESTIPVIKHYKGVCHLYVDKQADFSMALSILENGKFQRPGVCNALETVLIHEEIAEKFVPEMKKLFAEKGLKKVYGDEKYCKLDAEAASIPEENYSNEYLDTMISAKIVSSVEEAVEHINFYGSGHSDSIVTADGSAAEYFQNYVDSATVYWNASTRFTDGGEFGMGAEIGISTDKLHARGPMGLRELTTYKYKIYGNGQIRK